MRLGMRSALRQLVLVNLVIHLVLLAGAAEARSTSKTRRAPATGSAFTMEAFSRPTHPSLQRPTNWPDHVEFDRSEVIPVTAQSLQGVWRLALLCDGYPIPASVLAQKTYFSGASESYEFLDFRFDGLKKVERLFSGSILDLIAGRVPTVRIEESCAYNVAQKKTRGTASINISCFVDPIVVRMVRVRDNDELLLEGRSAETDRDSDEICGRNRSLRTYRIRRTSVES